MKSKVSILILAFLFFTSATGLPLVMHYCEMMESATFDECEMHNPEAETVTCCEEEIQNNLLLKKVDDECCQFLLVDKSLKENFISSKTELSLNQLSEIIADIITPVLSSDDKNFSQIDSPPPLTSNHLYLVNSILLI